MISLGLVVAVVGTLWLKGVGWGRSVTTVEVWLGEVAGLTEGNPVVYLGVPIGRVSDIAVDQSGAFVRVTVELEGEVELQPDTRGLVSPQSFFGDWQIEITPLARFPRLAYYPVPEGYTENGVPVIGGYAIPDILPADAGRDRDQPGPGDPRRPLRPRVQRGDRGRDRAGGAGRRALSNEVQSMIEQQGATFAARGSRRGARGDRAEPGVHRWRAPRSSGWTRCSRAETSTRCS